MGNQKYPKVAGYTLLEQIGGGGFATVFKAASVNEGRSAACKLIYITERTTEKDRKTFDKEMRIHAALKHRNILEFINAVVVELDLKATYVPGIYMLLEFAGGGDLFDKIAADVGVSEKVAHLYFNELISGMTYIHSQGVCHRDLKPENLLLDAAGNLKITDFGLSAVFRLKDIGKERKLSEKCGSMPYIAPEVTYADTYSAEPIDVWGVGVILFTMLAGNTPWDEPTEKSPEFRAYLDGSIFREDPWNRLPSGPLGLIKGMLHVDPKERLTLREVYEDEWVLCPSQLTGKGPSEIAESLMESLKCAGELEIANPSLDDNEQMDEDGDAVMFSQFTQSLMLFSQTQSGTRYTPHLTRFYASLPPQPLFELIHQAFLARGPDVVCKVAPPEPVPGQERSSNPDFALRLRVGGLDRRNQTYKGWVTVEPFSYRGQDISFVVMQRDKGNPLSWRLVWKGLIESPQVTAHVMRKT